MRLRRLLSTSSTRVLCGTITPPSTASRPLNSVTSFTITLRTLWQETPNFIWAKSITGKASTRRRSRHYDAVLEQYSGNSKAPAAELRKGQSLIEMGQKDAGVRELRTLVQRYPQTPEAQEARSKLNGMGVRIYAAKPSAYPPTSP